MTTRELIWKIWEDNSVGLLVAWVLVTGITCVTVDAIIDKVTKVPDTPEIIELRTKLNYCSTYIPTTERLGCFEKIEEQM